MVGCPGGDIVFVVNGEKHGICLITQENANFLQQAQDALWTHEQNVSTMEKMSGVKKLKV